MVSTGTRSKQITVTPLPASLAQTGARRQEHEPSLQDAPKAAGYGLPCAKCHLYYTADLEVCPYCHHKERVSPVVPKTPVQRAETLPDPVPDSAIVEQEREEFLRQFKSQLLEVHSEVAHAHASLCALTEQHDGGESSAEICKACYQRLEHRMNVLGFALEMDVKEAAQIIYDAVWADPSDPGKTYENAAAALLHELQKRAGMNSGIGPFQPISD